MGILDNDSSVVFRRSIKVTHRLVPSDPWRDNEETNDGDENTSIVLIIFRNIVSQNDQSSDNI